MLAPNNNRGVTYQTDKKHLNNMSEYFVGVVKIVFNRYRLGVAHPFLMLKAFLFDFAIKITPQALAFWPNRRHQSIQRKI